MEAKLEARVTELEQAVAHLQDLIIKGLDRIEAKIGSVHEVVVGDDVDEEQEKPALPSDEWDEFVAASGLNARLEFTPETLYQALVDAIADGDSRYPNRPHLGYCWSSSVAWQLTDRPSKSDVLRVVVGLRKLEQEGRIRGIRKYGQGAITWELGAKS